MICGVLADHVNLALAADHVHPLAFRVEEHVVRILADRQPRDDLTRSSVIDEERRRRARSHEEAVVVLVERHREVGGCTWRFPSAHDSALRAIDNYHASGCRYVYEGATTSLLEL